MDVSLVKNGVVEQVISAESVEQAVPFFPDFTCYFNPGNVEIGATYANDVFTNPVVAAPPEARYITKLDWLSKFTLAELGSINLAQLDQATAPQIRAGVATIILAGGRPEHSPR